MTFDLFRLNEGHTMFAERKITGRLHNDEALSQFMALGGAKELKEEIVICATKFSLYLYDNFIFIIHLYMTISFSERKVICYQI